MITLASTQTTALPISGSAIQLQLKTFNDDNRTSMFEMILNNIDNLDLLHCSTFIDRVAKLRTPITSDEKIIVGRIIEKTSRFIKMAPRDIALILNAIATGFLDKHVAAECEILLKAIKTLILKEEVLRSCESRDIATICLCYAKLHRDDEGREIMTAFSSEIKRRRNELHTFTDQSLTNIVWVFARKDIKDEELIRLISGEIQKRGFETYLPKGISNILFGMASLNHSDSGLFKLASAEITKRNFKGFSEHDLGDIFVAFAKSRCYDRDFFNLACNEILLRKWTPFANKDIASIMHSLALCKHVDLDFLGWASKALLKERRQFSAQEISMLTWSFAKLDYRKRELFGMFLQMVQPVQLRNFTPADLSRMLWAFAKQDDRVEPLCRMVSAEIRKRNLHSFSLGDLCQILWAFGKQRDCDMKLFGVISREIQSRNVHLFTTNDVADVALSFARVNIRDERLFRFLQLAMKECGVVKFEKWTREVIVNAFDAVDVKLDERLLLQLRE
jgi:hypothetical protein